MKGNRITFLGTMYVEESISELLKDTIGNLQFAGDTYQKALLKGFEHKINTRVFSAYQVGSFPKRFKKLNLNSYEKFSNEKIKVVPFINLTYYKTYSIKASLKKYIKKVSFFDNEKIIVYSMDYSLLSAAVEVKKRYPDVHIHLIITDICEYMSSGKIATTVNKMWQRKIINLFPFVDSFTVMTKFMVDKLKITKPYVIVEGINNMQVEQYDYVKKKDTFVILYTGTLEKRYGILHLLNAFSFLPKNINYKLWICGNGDAKEDVVTLEKKDSRIKYYGLIPRNEVLRLQQKANLLINPRFSKDEYTLFSFPSKTIEYMLSGTPLLMHRLPGIPKEYEPFIFYSDDESDEGFSEKIYEISRMTVEELNKKGELAKKFIIENKNCYKQVEKILEVLN